MKKQPMEKVEVVLNYNRIRSGYWIEKHISQIHIPKGKYAYECRHGDDLFPPLTVEKKPVVVNFCGTLILDEPYEFRLFGLPTDYVDIEEFSFVDGDRR